MISVVLINVCYFVAGAIIALFVLDILNILGKIWSGFVGDEDDWF